MTKTFAFEILEDRISKANDPMAITAERLLGGEDEGVLPLLDGYVKAAEAGRVPLAEMKGVLKELDRALVAAGEEPTKPTKKGKPVTTKPNYTTKEEVVQEVDRLARELMAKDPKLTLSQAKSRVWEQNPELARQYKELPASSKAPNKPVPVRKGSGTLLRVEAEAAELMKADPTLTSPAQARSRVWETRTDLAEDYRKASCS